MKHEICKTIIFQILRILNKYNKLLEKGTSKEDAIDELVKTYPFFNEESIKAVCNQTYTIGRDSLKYGLNRYKMV